MYWMHMTDKRLVFVDLKPLVALRPLGPILIIYSLFRRLR